MAYFDICPICGATLDPHEKCECEKKETARQEPKRNVKNQYQYIREIQTSQRRV